MAGFILLFCLMKYLFFLLPVLLCSCHLQVQESTAKKNKNIESFTIYNPLDSMVVQTIPVDSNSRLVVVGKDTIWESLPIINGYNYYTTPDDRQLAFTDEAFDKITRFINAVKPTSSFYIPDADIKALKNYIPHTLLPGGLRKHLPEFKTAPDSLQLVEDDFDRDGSNEVLLNIAKGKTGYAILFEKRKQGYQPVQHFNLNTMHYGIEYLVYNKTANVFLLRQDQWSSCGDYDLMRLLAYAGDSLVWGPVLAVQASTATNCDPDTGITYMYYAGVESVLKPLRPDHFSIQTQFSISAYHLEKEEVYDHLFEKEFNPGYFFDRTSNRFKQETGISEEEYFSEPYRFLQLVKAQVLNLKKNGPEKTREWLRDFDYFDE